MGSGYVASQGASSLTNDVTQSETHPYAKFTMESITGSLTNFLVKPSQVAYQGVENQYSGGTVGDVGYSLPNEAYGTPTGTQNWYSSKSIDMSTMSEKTGYTNWKDDLIWLPSLTEVGSSNTVYGIWGLSDAQRYNSATSWLRSGTESMVNYAYSLVDADVTFSSNYVNNSYAVRPALHLNLSGADGGSAKTLSNPTDFKVTYDGSSHDITDASWYDEDIYGNADKMSVTYSATSPTDYGEYTVTLTIKNGLAWKDAKSPSDKTRTCKMTIEKASPNITPVIGSYTLYAGDTLEKFPSISLPDNAPSGTISWDSGQTATTTKAYNWTFKSTDNNYTDKKGSTTLTVTGLDISTIEASYTSSGTIYTSTSLDSLKSGLTVTKKYNNGTSAGTATADEYVLEGSLTTGESTITVKLKKDGAITNISTTFKVTVVKVELSSITATLSSGSTVYTTTQLDDIKAMLTVTGTNNDGSTTPISSDKYSLSCSTANSDGTLPLGNNRLTLTYSDNSDITCDVAVIVQEISVASIEVTKLDNFPTTLFTTTGLNTLKQYLKVVATFADADNTTKEIDAKDYTIEGKLIAGKTCTLTIKYGGKSKTISVTGVIAVEVTKLEATSTGESLYSSASEEDIKGILIVTATYNNNTDDVLAADGYEVELPEGGLSSTNNTVTIKCGDKTVTVTLDITDVASTGIEVEYTDSGDITIDSSLEELLSGIKLTLKYNDGSSEVIAATADMLSVSMDSIG
ncbi:MAG: hypothetical protein K2I79_03170, partial [Clostridia bacterium]|nr:hypothetical protein [Clostridia bacterium]